MAENQKTPIIFIPGLMGTHLYGKILGVPKEYWPSFSKLFFTGLELDKYGNSPKKLYTNGIITKILHTHFYDIILDYFKNKGYSEGVDFFTLPYDWRKSVSTDAARDLHHLVDSIISEGKSHNGKVIIIAHSMGGVVASTWLAQDLENNNNKLEKIFYVGTPFFGAPKMLCPLIFGNNNPYPWLLKKLPFTVTDATVKQTTRNMDGLYSLLPYQYYPTEGGNYYENKGKPVNHFGYDNSSLNLNQEMVINELGSSHDRIEELTVFADGDKREFIPSLIKKSFFVYGNGLNTISCVYGNNENFQKIDQQPCGDETVPSFGLAELVGGKDSANKKEVTGPNGNHTKLIQNSDVLDWILDKIQTDVD